jgi:hypothetical protein
VYSGFLILSHLVRGFIRIGQTLRHDPPRDRARASARKVGTPCPQRPEPRKSPRSRRQNGL